MPPPGYQTYRLSSGGFADVPNDKADEWARRMNQRGIQFEPAQVEAEMTVGEPEVIKTPPAAPQQGWGADEDMGFMERFSRGAKGYAQDFGRAGEGLVRGLNQSLYQGGSDEVAAGGRAALGEEFGAALKDEQAANDRAWNETPITYGAGRAMGFIPGMFMGGPAKAGAMAAVKRIGGNAALSGVNGFLGNDGDLGDRTEAAARDSLLGLAGGVGGEALMRAAPPVARAGLDLRRANAGGSQPELNAIRMNKGIDQMESGVTDDFASLGLADSWKPQSAADVYRKLGPEKRHTTGVIPEAGREVGRSLDDAEAVGMRGDWNNVDDAMLDRSNALMTQAPQPSAPTMSQADELWRIRENELPPGDIQEFRSATPRELHQQKREFEGNAYPREGTVRLESDAPRAEAYRGAAHDVRDELRDVMAGAGPDINQRFDQNMGTIARATPIADMAGTRAASNQAGSSLRNPINLAMMSGGMAPGLLTGNPLMAAAGGAAMYGANALGRSYGQDIAGLGMRAGANTMGGMGSAMDAGSRMAGPIAGMAEQGMQPDHSSGLPGETRGYLTPDVVRQLVTSNPMALGPYTQQFHQAMSSGDDGDVVRLLDRLEVTDPRWQQQYLPRVLQMTGQQPGMR